MSPTKEQHYDDFEYFGRVQRAWWPQKHKPVFRHIQELGTTIYEQYCNKQTKEHATRPWMEKTIRRVDEIIQRAEYKCKSKGVSEADWRVLDSDIFSAFEWKTVCSQCNQRVWRSEIEVHFDENHHSAKALKADRERRSSCDCPMKQSNGQPRRPRGIDDELLVKTELTFSDELNVKRIPDRVHGLRLFDGPNCGSSSLPSIQTHPFSKSAKNPPLFPFLVHEAKKCKTDTQAQMKLPIRCSLRIQEGLRDASGSGTWYEGPLVWVLTNMGEIWAVSAAYVQDEGPEPKYRVIELWLGKLSCENGALQLLLILDYILDWARDFYRPTIIRELKTLADQQPHLLDHETFEGVHYLSTETIETSNLPGRGEQIEDPAPKISNETTGDSRRKTSPLDSKPSTPQRKISISSTRNTGAGKRVSGVKEGQSWTNNSLERDQSSPVSSQRSSKRAENAIETSDSEGSKEGHDAIKAITSSLKRLSLGRKTTPNRKHNKEVAAADEAMQNDRDSDSRLQSPETTVEETVDIEEASSVSESSDIDEGTWSSEEGVHVSGYRTPSRRGDIHYTHNTPPTELSLHSLESATTVDPTEGEATEIYTPTRPSRKLHRDDALTSKPRRRELSSPL